MARGARKRGMVVAYVLMMQCSTFPNSDASDVRREFQKAAATAFANGKVK